MGRYQVQCIVKKEPHDIHDHIQYIGGIVETVNGKERWKLSQEDTITYIDTKTHQFFVSKGGATADVIVLSRNNKKYIRTTTDGTKTDNLLELPKCP